MEKTFASLAAVLCVASLGITACSRKEVAEQATAKPEIKDTINLSAKAIERFGLSIVTVKERANSHPLVTTGEIKADENRVFHINSLANGRVIKDNAMLGDVIRAGQTIAVVQNLDVAKIYGDYIHEAHANEIQIHLSETRLALAKKNFDRLNGLYREGIAAEKDFLKAESDKKLEEETLRGNREHSTHIKEEAEAMLAAYGVKLGDTHSEHVQSSSPITTPRAGVIIKKTVTVGDVVTSSDALYVVGDLSHVWLDIAVYDKQLQSITEGDLVTFTSDSLPGRSFSSRISYIKPSTEGDSGTFVARAILDNPHMDLKPGMLGQVEIRTQRVVGKPYLPENAVQKYGNESFVFLELGNNSYKRQNVELGEHVDGGYFIINGVHLGERVVGNGSFTLKAEMLKGAQDGEE